MTPTAICKACHTEHADVYAAYCGKCREVVLAAFMARREVFLPLGAPDRPVRKMEARA